MSGSELPLSYRRLSRAPGDRALDAITVDPESSGQLHLPGTYSNLSPPPAYRYRITPTGDHGVDAVPVQTGTTREYVVRVDIQNHRQTALTVRLYWVREPETEEPAPPPEERHRRRRRPDGGEPAPDDPSPEDQAEQVLADLSGATSRPELREAASFPDDEIAEMVEEANDTDR